MKRKNALILAIVWLLVMVGVIASTVTLMVSGGSFGRGRWVSSEEYETIERYRRLEAIREELTDYYYQEIDQETLLNGAARGMMDALEEPYTFYYTPEEMASHDAQNEGAYVGVGLLVQNNAQGYIEIIRVYENGPADLGGAKSGDWIVAVDGTPVSGESIQSLNDAVNRMKGEAGAPVDVGVMRDGERLDLRFERGAVNVSNVSWEMLEGNIAYINIFQFSGDAVSAFQAALEAAQAADAQGIVIDLRNNPGGLLDDVVEIADLLLPEGCIVYIEDRAGAREDFYSDGEYCDLPLAILVNDMSASASEILAAAVQDFDRGIVLGTQTYGKGIVQTLVRFDEDGAGMQYTSACYYTPSGRSIHGTGVTPDIVIEADSDDAFGYGTVNLDRDIQLRSALEWVSAEIGKIDAPIS